jgi:chromosome segregation ATPase
MLVALAAIGRERERGRVSDEKISLEWLGSRVLTLTAELRDLQLRFRALEQRFGGLEHRFTAMESRLSGIEGRLGSLESRFDAQEDRMTAMLALLVRVAERIESRPP